MLNALKARLRASVCLHLTAEAWREVIKAFTLMIYRLVRPGSIAAQRLGCDCRTTAHLLNNCPYHGLAARKVVLHG